MQSATLRREHEGSARPPIRRMAIVALVSLAIVGVAAVYPLISPIRDAFPPASPAAQGAAFLAGLAWLATLLVAMARQPGGRLWQLILAYIVADRLAALEFVPDSLAWSVGALLENVWAAVFIHLVLAYPTGNLRDRFDRAVVLFGYALIAALPVSRFLFGAEAQFACTPECIRNVFGIWPDLGLVRSLERSVTVLAVGVLVPLVLFGLWRHWRDAGAASRRTLLPLVVAVPLLAIVMGLEQLSRALEIPAGRDFFGSPSGAVILLLVPLILPIGLLTGMVRARWGRARIAGLVVELGRGVPVGSLRDVLARTLGDPTLELAFAAPSGTGFVDASGLQIDLPIDDAARMVTRLEREGELLGILVHDPAIEAEDPGLVEAVGNAARLALENERLAAEVRAQLEEVRASRVRIVDATDAERRRIERDLHDGAQQRLVALAMRLELARAANPSDAGLLEEATAELRTAIGEVRGLARGVHPTILTEAGLHAAIEALVERAPLPVTVEVTDRRYDPRVEATAYFVVAEALTNVARHASATEARVSAVEEQGRLIVTIRDDGAGGADPAAGSGLRGLEDRLAAFGGDLRVASPRGSGTMIRAELPLEITQPTTTADEGSNVTAQLAESDAPQAAARRPGSGLAAVRAISDVPSAHRRDPRIDGTHPARVMLAVIGLLVVGAAAAAVIGASDRPPEEGRAEDFARPFVYQVPAGSGIQLYRGRVDALGVVPSSHLHVLAAPGAGEGISIWDVASVLVDPCSDDGRTRALEPGAAALLASLRSVHRLVVSDPMPVTIDARPATRADLTVEGQDSGCPDRAMYLWRESEGNGAITVPDDGRVRLIVVDVDQATIAFEIWSQLDVAAWETAAESIIGSVRFLHEAPAETAPAIPPLSP